MTMKLGPANSWLIYMAKKPLPLRYQRVSLCIDPTIARIFNFIWSTPSYEEASTQIKHLLIAYIT